jgi:hypothetical protein
VIDLVFIHGPAASGKLTTARELEQLTGYPVFHNHLVVDMLTLIFPFGSPEFVALREKFWIDVFGSAARVDRSLIFTFAPEPTVRAGFPQRVADVVEPTGGRVCWVALAVESAEQERRLVEPGRREFRKLSDPAVLRQLRAGPAGEQPPADIEIDTTRTPPGQTAGQIVEHFGLRRQARLGRYPSVDPPA